jgi:hypothetical protein
MGTRFSSNDHADRKSERAEITLIVAIRSLDCGVVVMHVVFAGDVIRQTKSFVA